jgi:hypothetical protein
MHQIATVMDVFFRVRDPDPHPDLDPYVFGPHGSHPHPDPCILPLGDSIARLLQLVIGNCQLPIGNF